MAITTWVFAEEIAGAPSPSALEMLTKARSLEGDLATILVGNVSDETLAALGANGASKVFHMETGDALPSSGESL